MVIGVILALLLVIVVYTVRKYLLQKETYDKERRHEKVDLKFKNPSATGSSSGFEVPITTRPVQRQVPPTLELKDVPVSLHYVLQIKMLLTRFFKNKIFFFFWIEINKILKKYLFLNYDLSLFKI